jgi:hypothetical protein
MILGDFCDGFLLFLIDLYVMDSIFILICSVWLETSTLVPPCLVARSTTVLSHTARHYDKAVVLHRARARALVPCQAARLTTYRL